MIVRYQYGQIVDISYFRDKFFCGVHYLVSLKRQITRLHDHFSPLIVIMSCCNTHLSTRGEKRRHIYRNNILHSCCVMRSHFPWLSYI